VSAAESGLGSPTPPPVFLREVAESRLGSPTPPPVFLREVAESSQHSSTIDSLLTEGPTRLMGIVNVTPDSFSDGGGSLDVSCLITSAIQLGVDLTNQGAHLIDVGGESTRPGATRVSESVELARVIPVVEALAGQGIAVSVDTVRAVVAEQAIAAGAVLINDVSGGLADPRILDVVAKHQVGYVLGHWSTPFDHGFSHTHVVEEVRAELTRRIRVALESRVNPELLIVDPGIGFGKTNKQNWELIASVDQIQSLGYPTLWGVSRKRFLAQSCVADGNGTVLSQECVKTPPSPSVACATEPHERDSASVEVGHHLAHHGVWGLRVHNVAEHVTNAPSPCDKRSVPLSPEHVTNAPSPCDKRSVPLSPSTCAAPAPSPCAAPAPSPCAAPTPSPCAKSQGPDSSVVRLRSLDSASPFAPQNDAGGDENTPHPPAEQSTYFPRHPAERSDSQGPESTSTQSVDLGVKL